MPDDKQKYLHGYSSTEQQRLISQAAFWRNELILPDLPYEDGDSLLDVGCGAGAVLGELGIAHPRLALHGIDIAKEQIQMAQVHLSKLGLHAELRVGNALHLPWENNTFNHVYMMWFLEHLKQPVLALKEALRILKPGGSLTINCRTSATSGDSTRFS